MNHNFIKVSFFLICSLFTAYGRNEKPITIVFRYDDFSSHINIEEFIIDTFNKYNYPITFGIIPTHGHINYKAVETLKEADRNKKVEIAMHGYHHQRGELLGTFDEQYKLLEKGKKILEKTFNVGVKTFIPPYNLYSLSTIKVLDSLKFKVISSATYSGISPKNSKIIFLPATSSFISLKSDINQARNLVRKIKLDKCIIIVLFHPYDFRENISAGSTIKKDWADMIIGDTSEKDFADLIKWISTQNDINIKSLSQASDLIDGKNFINYNEVYHIFYLVKYLPFYQHAFVNNFYPSLKYIRNLVWKLYLFFIIYYLALLLISITVSYNFMLKVRIKKINIFLSFLILLLIFLIYSLPVKFEVSLIVLILGLISGRLLLKYKSKTKIKNSLLLREQP